MCRRFNLELFSKKISLRPVELFHHIYRLKEQEEKLSQFEIQTLNSNLDETISALPKIFKEYELLKDTLSLISSLAVKWNAVNVNNYAFRMSGRTMNIKVLDLKELNSDLFTVETIWLATMIKEEPFSKIIDDQVAQYGYLLCQITPKLINSILSLNQHCNMTETTSIAGLVAAKKPKVARFSGVDPDYESEVVAYQRMKLKRGFLSFCIRDRDLKNVKEIKNMIEDFENVYRNFEESLMICILSMSKAGKEVV